MMIHIADAILHALGCAAVFIFFAVVALIFALLVDAAIMVVKDIYRRIKK